MKRHKRMNRRMTNRLKSTVSVLLASSMVLNPLNGIQIAIGSELNSTRVTVKGSKADINLSSAALREAAVNAIQNGVTFTPEAYVGLDTATDAAFENLLTQGSSLYELDLFDAEDQDVFTEAGIDVKLLIQKDPKAEDADLDTETASASNLKRKTNVSFDYQAKAANKGKEILFYQKGSPLDSLIGNLMLEDINHADLTEAETAEDNSSYVLTGSETVTILYMNTAKDKHTFKLSVDGKAFSGSVTVEGNESAVSKLKKQLKKDAKEELTGTTEATAEVTEASTEETTRADATETAAVDQDNAVEPETAAKAEESSTAADSMSAAETEESTSTEAATEAETQAETRTEAQTEEVSQEETTEKETEAQTEKEVKEEEATAEVEQLTKNTVTAIGSFTLQNFFDEAESQEVKTAEAETEAEEETTTEAEEQTEAAKEETTAEETTAENKESTEETTAAEETTAEANVEIAAAETEESKETEAETKAITAMDESLAEERAQLLSEQTVETLAENTVSAKAVQYTLDDLTSDFKSVDLGAYLVKVYPVADNAIDNSWTLKATELLKDDQTEADAKTENPETMSTETAEALKEAGIYDNSASLDIHFEDADGNEVEPNGKVRVEIEVAKEALDETATSLNVYHVEEKDGSIQDVKALDTTTQALDQTGEALADSQAIVTETVENTEAVAAVAETEDENSTAATQTVEKFSDEVAKVKTSFTVESFSTFTITWKQYSSLKLTIITEDLNGNEINAYGLAESELDDQEGEVYGCIFTDDNLHFFVPNYTVQDAYYVSNGKEIIVSRVVPVSSQSSWKESNERKGNKPQPQKSTVLKLYGEDGSTVVAEGTQLTVHVRYKPVDGEDKIPDADHDLGALAHEKTLSSNNDGTYTLSLNATGRSERKTENDKVNIIVVLDLSKSMEQTPDGNEAGRNDTTRLEIARDAVKTLGKTVLNGNDDITLELVTFNKSASLQGKYSSKTLAGFETLSDFETKVDGLDTDYYTNWEGGLKTAYNNLDENRANYVVFVSDGEPTWCDEGYIGPSSFIPNNYSYKGLKVAKEIVKKADFYAISAFDGATGMSWLTENAYEGTNVDWTIRSFSGTSEETVKAAFKEITKQITHAYSYKAIKITDVLTNNTAFEAASDSSPVFTYKIKTKKGKTYTVKAENNVITSLTDEKGAETSLSFTDENTKLSYQYKKDESFPTASYTASTRTIEWNMGDNFVLPDGCTYTVELRVWPSQEAYDNAADWKNNPSNFTEAYTAAAEGYKKDGDEYKLYSNKKAWVDYKTVSYTNGVSDENERNQPKADYEKPDPMPLIAAPVKITKEWSDNKDHSNEVVTMQISDSSSAPASIELSSTNNWTKTWYLAPGLNDGRTNLDAGHTYTISELKVMKDAEDVTNQYKASFRLNDTDVTGDSVSVKPMLVPEDSMIVIKDMANSSIAWGTNYQVTTTNTPIQKQLTIQKTVTGTGAVVDTTDGYKFTVEITGPNGAALTEAEKSMIGGWNTANTDITEGRNTDTYTVVVKPSKVGEAKSSAAILLPAGYQYQITEDKSNCQNYKTTVDGVNGDGMAQAATLNNDATVSFVNTYDIPSPTGVHRDILPYVISMGIALAGAAMLLLELQRKRRMSE